MLKSRGDMRINIQKLLPVIIRDNYTTLMQMIVYDQIKTIDVYKPNDMTHVF
jgi:hypothetical protein